MEETLCFLIENSLYLLERNPIQEMTEHVYYSEECSALCMLFARQNSLLPSYQVIVESQTILGYLCNFVVRKCRLNIH